MSAENCFHCGDEIAGKPIVYAEKEFCCNGCKGVFQLLNDNNMGAFYQMENAPGTKPSAENSQKYSFLDVGTIREKFIEFEDGTMARINLHLPTIHCSSCIYLLENISKIENRIVSCQVNFSKREASLVFKSEEIKLSELALLLDRIGYPANFGSRSETEKNLDRTYLYKLGVAGFAFGSIMLWSFPEYLGIESDYADFRNFSAYLSLGISIPVLLYSARDYFISAFKALRHKSLNLDVPITIGIIALYFQSAYTILSGDGPGYMDSFAGFIFFLLIGKWFQSKTYRMLSFERDYTSYFPLAITRIKENFEEIIEIDQLQPDDHIVLRNDEVLPCDSILLSDSARIDYSFVTGESQLIHKKKGDFIYAGGRLEGYRIELKVQKESSRSQLTRLWNEIKTDEKNVDDSQGQSKLSYYFLIALLIIAAGASVYWFFRDASQIYRIVVSILIVACPCALALSRPFTYGNIMRLLGRKGLYLKNVEVIEKINSVTDIVLDKTGTLSESNSSTIHYFGDELNAEEKSTLFAMTQASTHPISRAITTFLKNQFDHDVPDIHNFEEIKGKGISGNTSKEEVKIGSADFCEMPKIELETASYIRIGSKQGRFVLSTHLRSGIQEMIARLSSYKLHVISGDSSKDKAILSEFFPPESALHFSFSPKDKLNYIEALKLNNRKVMMIGDGLNDAGALAKADVGVAVSEEVFRFTPSSDAIIEATKLRNLDDLMSVSAYAKTMIRVCLIFSISYNIIGLSIAISGNLSPLVAAILMPLSSITVVLLSTLMAFFRK